MTSPNSKTMPSARRASFTSRNIILTIVCTLLFTALLMLPTGFKREIYYRAHGARATVLTVDNSMLLYIGMFRSGEQQCTVQLKSGPLAGQTHQAVNMFTGSLENDKVFGVGDTAWVLVEQDDSDNVLYVNMVDHYRLAKLLLLAFMFAVALVWFARMRGVRTIISFVISFMVIWKVLVPMSLKGYPPMLMAFICGIVIAAITLAMVSNNTKAALSAFIGTMLGSIVVLLLSAVMLRWFKLDGTQMSWSESLLYNGFGNLDIRSLFQGAIYLGCLGAMMDLCIDVAITMAEVDQATGGLAPKNVFKSGIEIGRAGVGTQTTTLLFAYLSSYLAVLMVYMAQGTPVQSILTSKAVSSEIVLTLIGCIALVLSCPMTAGAYMLCTKRGRQRLTVQQCEAIMEPSHQPKEALFGYCSVRDTQELQS